MGPQMKLQAHRAFTLDPEEAISSPVTRQKAAAAKQFIENHYKNYLQGLQDRKERSNLDASQILTSLYFNMYMLDLFHLNSVGDS